MKDVYLTRPSILNQVELNKLQQKLYVYLEAKLDPIWDKFPYGCENICLMSDEIVDNTFLHDNNTRSLRFRLKVADSGEIEVKIWHDGLSYNDQTAPRGSQVVRGIIKRLAGVYSTTVEESEGDVTLTDSSPKECRIITFKLVR